MWQTFIGIFISGLGLGALIEFAIRKIVDKSIDDWFQKRNEKRNYLNERLFTIYGKLRHDTLGITIISARVVIPWQVRLNVALKHLLEGKPKQAWKALVKDYNKKGLTDSYEFEHFSGFDLEGAKNHIKKHRKYADHKLVKKLDAAIRAENELRYYEALEQSSNSHFTYGHVVTPQTYELISYIDSQFEKLSKKLHS